MRSEKKSHVVSCFQGALALGARWTSIPRGGAEGRPLAALGVDTAGL